MEDNYNLSLPEKIKLTDNELKEVIQITESHIGSLEYELGKLEQEVFYRNNPESRPRQ